MKETFIRAKSLIAKTIYKLIKTIKQIGLQFREWFSSIVLKKNKRDSSRKVYDFDNKSANSAVSQRTKKALWKDKRIIASICVIIVAAAVVFIFTLPKSQNAADASSEIALAGAIDKSTENDLSAPLTSTSEESSDSIANAGSEPVSSEDIPVSGADGLEPLPTATLEPVSSAAAEEVTSIPTTAPDNPDLVPGCNDVRIIEVQTQLMDLGYMGADEPTDYYGYGTEYALQLFQRKNSLQVDGLLGEQTLTSLFSDDALPYTVKLGDKGSDVAGIQEQLQKLKYLNAGSTGYFGTDTEKAVKNFQSRNGLSADGSVGENTFEMLYSDDAKAAKTSTGGGGSSSGGSSGGGSSSGGGNQTPPAAGPNEASANTFIEFAKTQLGKKYVKAGKGPDVFDCSGFVYYCLNQSGYGIKYMTSAGWARSGFPKISKMADLLIGDIVCFKGHVGIYMGGGQMIDASSGAGQIRICSNIFSSSYWTRNFICGRRVF